MIRKTRSQRSQRRQRPPRSEGKRVLVVTEGRLTEPQYVERLDSYLRNKGLVSVVKTVPVGKDPYAVVEKCVSLRDEASSDGREFDFCVCLVDVDSHTRLEQACTRAKGEGILLLISNVKFEVWLRWHVEDKRSALTSEQLDRLVEQHQLLSGKALANSFPIGNHERACVVARQADPALTSCRKGPDPSSAMPILVDLLKHGDVQ